MATVNSLPIGIFDSGIGGLTVYRRVRELLPDENIIYFGDTGRAPYGSRQPKQIRQFVDEIMKFMSLCNVKLGIVACNTITVLGVDTLSKNYNFQLVGNSLGAVSALGATRNRRIGVIATETTIRSQKHRTEILRLDPGASVFAQPCPQLASLIEAGEFTGHTIENALGTYLAPLREQCIDTLILGCTHYPYVIDLIQQYLGERVTIVDPATETAEHARDFLAAAQSLTYGGAGASRFYFSANSDTARSRAARLFNTTDAPFSQLDLSVLAGYCAQYNLYSLAEARVAG